VLSGSTHGITGDSCPQPPGNQPTWHANCSTLAGFTGYSEDLPSVCFTGCSAPDRRYARNHKRSVDFANLPQDLAALPTVAVVVPNLCPTCTTAP
jgi:phosphatidylinositol-3-phosphatase